jgi:hypothetical protein
MTAPTSAPVLTLRIPADQLYWSRVAAADVPATRSAQLFRCERTLPVPIEQLHWSLVRLRNRDVLLVAIEHDRLRRFVADAPAAAAADAPWRLLPEQLPAHIAAGLEPAESDRLPERLNLLTGRFEPKQRRHLRQALWLAIHAGLALIVVALLVGSERRVHRLEEQAAAARVRLQSLLAEAAPRPAEGRSGPDLSEPRLLMELRRLEQVADSMHAASEIDAAGLLQDLWSHWPKELAIQVDAFTITPGHLSLNAKVPSLGDAERLASACALIGAGGLHYRADPLQAQMGEAQASLSLSWTRVAGGAGKGPTP